MWNLDARGELGVKREQGLAVGVAGFMFPPAFDRVPVTPERLRHEILRVPGQFQFIEDLAPIHRLYVDFGHCSFLVLKFVRILLFISICIAGPQTDPPPPE